MANSRIMLVCKHCGGDMVIGKGYYGKYHTCNEEMYSYLNAFYDTHARGLCCGDINVSDNARDHFVILEEGETLDVFSPEQKELYDDTVRA